MFDEKAFRRLMDERDAVDEWHEPDLSDYWKRLSSFVNDNQEGFIRFLDNGGCSRDDLLNLSEVFDEIVEADSDGEVTRALRRAFRKTGEPSERFDPNLDLAIQIAGHNPDWPDKPDGHA